MPNCLLPHLPVSNFMGKAH